MYSIAVEIRKLKPELLIIGGRCSPSDRLLIRHLATNETQDIQFSEPGLAYRNDPVNIARDVLKKINNIQDAQKNNNFIRMNNRAV